ncbi:MAG: type II toxin-antitoxin system HicA family toxin [Fimbriimonadaceae bacterium]|nr:type II toxin-antitoxin system HicA family toxin [Fimbriimonadaceae bacterium]
MGRLRRLSGKEVCKILRQNGFSEVRTSGSHVIIQLRSAETTVTVPVPNHSEIKQGTLASIVRQSRLPRSAFED